MLTIVIKFIKTIFKIVITWIIIIESFFNFLKFLSLLGSNNIKLRALKVHLNTPKNRNVLVVKFRLTWVFMSIWYQRNKHNCFKFKFKKKRKWSLAKIWKLAIKNIYLNYQALYRYRSNCKYPTSYFLYIK